MKKVSFVIPCYRSAQTLPHVVKEIDGTKHLEINYYSNRLRKQVIYYYDEDENVSEKIYIDGFACKYPAFPINDPKSEIILDVYNNTKICSHLVHYYNKNIMHYDVDISYITNARMDTIGRFEVRYTNGAIISSNVYNKDTLKYIDFIMKMEEAVPMDFDRLRELDIK